MFQRFKDKLDNMSYLPVAPAFVFPLIAWVFAFYIGDYWRALLVTAVGSIFLLHFVYFTSRQGKAFYQVTLSKLDENAEPQETIKKHATLIHVRELKRLMRGKGDMTLIQWWRFRRRLHNKQWANHFPKPIRGNTYMLVISYHRN